MIEGRLLTEEQLARLESLGIERITEHLNHKLYQNTRDNIDRVQLEQIVKGAEKYPEPLNPASWTGREIVEHGRQEAMDTFHYWEAAEEKFAEYEREIAELKAEIKRLKGE